MLLATAARLVKARGKSAKFVPVQSAFGEPRPCLFSLLQQFPIDFRIRMGSAGRARLCGINICLQEDDGDAEGLFGGFASTGVRDGAGWRFAARGGGGIFRCGQHRGQVASAVGGEWQRRGETARRQCLAAGGTCDGDSGGGAGATGCSVCGIAGGLEEAGNSRTSRSALWRFFGRHDITFKKKSL